MTITRILCSTSGRIPRQTFWVAMLGIWAAYFVSAGVVLGLAGALGTGNLGPGPLGALAFRALMPTCALVCSRTVMVKRWHDRGKSGIWMLINLVPCVGPLWSLIELGFLESTRGPNGFEEEIFSEEVMLDKEDPALFVPPIVGRRCFHCQEEIVSFIGAALCPQCKEPLHNRCSGEHVAARRHEDDPPKCNPARASSSALSSPA